MNLWFAVAFFDRGSRRITGHETNKEVHGPFPDAATRTTAIKEILRDNREDSYLAIVPFSIEGDDEAMAEVSEE